jgi:MEMO1 family protein
MRNGVRINNLKMNITRRPFVSGRFYSQDKNSLEAEIDNYISLGEKNDKKKIKAMIVPHASYYYSGKTAGTAYGLISNSEYKRVFIIGDSHSLHFTGIAGASYNLWETPLGRVEVDKDFLDKMKSNIDFFSFNNEAHDEDHIIEVQIPFLQKTIKNDFKIVPLSVGKITDKNIEELVIFLKDEIREDDLIVISCDLSHYPSGSNASKIDKETLNLITNKDLLGLEIHVKKTLNSEVPNEETLLCSYDSVKTIMSLSKAMKWEGSVINYSHSGDVSGDNNSVVGYGSLIFK